MKLRDCSLKIDRLTLFPKMFQGFLSESIIKRAQEKNIVEISIHNIRDYSKDPHKKVDDYATNLIFLESYVWKNNGEGR